MNKTVKTDLFRYNKKTSIISGLKDPGFRYLYFFRIAHKKKGLSRTLLKIILKILSIRYGFQIPVGTKIGKGFYIGHFGTIVINSNSKIGDYCNIAHLTTIGEAGRAKKKGAPVIGNKVWIGTGAVIVGEITIGDNVLVAPNTFVNIDVPSNSIVIGNPCKITSNENATKGYINNILK